MRKASPPLRSSGSGARAFEQIETYFGLYPTAAVLRAAGAAHAFACIAPVSLPVAVGLIVCVPLIPVAIAAVQTIAKRLLASYWSQYAELGDSFLETLQGLATLKFSRRTRAKQSRWTRRPRPSAA